MNQYNEYPFDLGLGPFGINDADFPSWADLLSTDQPSTSNQEIASGLNLEMSELLDTPNIVEDADIKFGEISPDMLDLFSGIDMYPQSQPEPSFNFINTHEIKQKSVMNPITEFDNIDNLSQGFLLDSLSNSNISSPGSFIGFEDISENMAPEENICMEPFLTSSENHLGIELSADPSSTSNAMTVDKIEYINEPKQEFFVHDAAKQLLGNKVEMDKALNYVSQVLAETEPESDDCGNNSDSNSSDVSMDSDVSSSIISSPEPESRKRTRTKLTSKVNRDQRKKEQNKRAALKYRNKKKEQNDQLRFKLDEEMKLQKSLKKKHKKLFREVKTLKKLMRQAFLVQTVASKEDFAKKFLTG